MVLLLCRGGRVLTYSSGPQWTSGVLKIWALVLGKTGISKFPLWLPSGFSRPLYFL